MLRSLVLLAALSIAPVALADAPLVQHGRGVYYFDGAGRCPYAGLGLRGANACNRISLEDGLSTVTVDKAHHKITFTNAASYGSKTLIGDFLFLGSGKTAAGVANHVAIHLRVEKKGAAFNTHIHAHVPNWDKISSSDFEPFQVVVSDGKKETSVMTPAQALSAVNDPKAAAKLIGELVEVRDNYPKTQVAGQHALADVTVAFGIGAVADSLLRAELTQLDKPGSHANVPALLAQGNWQLKITSLSSLLPKDAIRHDLFLFGLEDVGVLQPVKSAGLPKGTSITLKWEGGKGHIAMGNASQDFPRALEVMRNFLEFGFLGNIVSHQAGLHLK